MPRPGWPPSPRHRDAQQAMPEMIARDPHAGTDGTQGRPRARHRRCRVPRGRRRAYMSGNTAPRRRASRRGMRSGDRAARDRAGSRVPGAPPVVQLEEPLERRGRGFHLTGRDDVDEEATHDGDAQAGVDVVVSVGDGAQLVGGVQPGCGGIGHVGRRVRPCREVSKKSRTNGRSSGEDTSAHCRRGSPPRPRGYASCRAGRLRSRPRPGRRDPRGTRSGNHAVIRAPVAVVTQPGLPTRVWTMTVVEPNRVFEWATRVRGVGLTGRHEFREVPEGCENTLTVELTDFGAGLLGRVARARMQRSLETARRPPARRRGPRRRRRLSAQGLRERVSSPVAPTRLACELGPVPRPPPRGRRHAGGDAMSRSRARASCRSAATSWASTSSAALASAGIRRPAAFGQECLAHCILDRAAPRPGSRNGGAVSTSGAERRFPSRVRRRVRTVAAPRVD